MPRALILYESLYGDNEVLAHAIAEGLATRMTVDVMKIDTAPTEIPRDLDLLIIGGPTHMARLPTPKSRERAAEGAEEPHVSFGKGVREWLEDAHSDGNLKRVSAAAFGTNLNEPHWVHHIGAAAKRIHKRLRHLGLTIISPPQIFWVADGKGPLVEGEADRARQWGEELAANFGAEESRPGV